MLYKDIYNPSGMIYGVKVPLDADVTITKCVKNQGLTIKCNLCGRKDFLPERIWADSKDIPKVIVSHKCIERQIEQKSQL